MPTYQYECDACGLPLEVVQSFSEDALTQCPTCKAQGLRKVYGSVGVVFKGSGFYRTDSRSSDSKSATSSTAPASTTPTTTKSDSASSAASTSTAPSPTASKSKSAPAKPTSK